MRTVFICIAGMLGLCNIARAEFAFRPADAWSAVSAGTYAVNEARLPARCEGCSLEEINWLLNRPVVCVPAVALAKLPRRSAELRVETQVQELPPVPDSAMLALSAFASLGVVQAGRSLRRLQVAFVPEWYHAGGPAQIGYATAFDLEFDGLLLCWFDRPSDLRPVVCYRIPREPRSRSISQFFLRLEGARGPPGRCC